MGTILCPAYSAYGVKWRKESLPGLRLYFREAECRRNTCPCEAISALPEQSLVTLFFVKKSCAKKAFRGCTPPKPPPTCAPHDFRAIRVAILLRYSPEMKFAGTWWRISTQNREIAPQWLLFYSLYAVHGTMR